MAEWVRWNRFGLYNEVFSARVPGSYLREDKVTDPLFKRPTPDELDHRVMGKGKYRHLTPDEVSDRDPSYLVWAYETWAEAPCSELLYKATREEFMEDLRQRRVQRDQNAE